MLTPRILRFPPRPRLRICKDHHHHNRICHAIITHSFTSAARLRAKPLPPRRKIDENELEEKFIRGCGPGGQKINKTSCAVHLRHIPSGLQIKTQESRSQAQNRKIARRLLADKVEQMEKGSESRVEIKADILRKRKASRVKKAKRKYGNLKEGEEEEVVKWEDKKKTKNREKREKEKTGKGGGGGGGGEAKGGEEIKAKKKEAKEKKATE